MLIIRQVTHAAINVNIYILKRLRYSELYIYHLSLTVPHFYANLYTDRLWTVEIICKGLH